MGCTIIAYTEKGSKKQKTISFEKARHLPGKVWIDLTNPKREELEDLVKHYGFHHLTLEDCMHTIQRPKVEDYGDYFFLVARTIMYEEKQKIKSKQIAFFVGDKYLITVHKNRIDAIDTIMKRVCEDKMSILKRGPDYLLYEILDNVFDGYFTVLDKIEDHIEHVENDVVKNPTKKTSQKIFILKKDLLIFRKTIWPHREVINALRTTDLPNLSDETMPYFRDTYDHIIQVIDLTETYRELLSGLLETYLSTVSTAMNEVVKVLTVIASLMLVPTLISGIYGMNFKYMPELQWKLGYPFALGLMMFTMVGMWIYFQRRGWV